MPDWLVGLLCTGGYFVVGTTMAFVVGFLDQVEDESNLERDDVAAGIGVAIAWPFVIVIVMIYMMGKIPAWGYHHAATHKIRKRARTGASATVDTQVDPVDVDGLINKIRYVETLAELEVLEATIKDAVGGRSRDVDMAYALLRNDHVGGIDMSEVRYGAGAVRDAVHRGVLDLDSDNVRVRYLNHQRGKRRDNVD